MRGQKLRQGVSDVEVQNQVASSSVAGAAHRSTRTLDDVSGVVHKPPPALDSAHVLEYAVVDGSMTYRPTLYVDGLEVGPVPYLAICRNLSDDLLLLFHCDETWAVLGAAGGDTIEETKRQAEATYRGISAHWEPSGFTFDEAKRYWDDLLQASSSNK